MNKCKKLLLYVILFFIIIVIYNSYISINYHNNEFNPHNELKYIQNKIIYYKNLKKNNKNNNKRQLLNIIISYYQYDLNQL